MKTYTITHDQLMEIIGSLSLAKYFIDGQEPSSDQRKSDEDTLFVSQRAIANVLHQVQEQDDE